MDSVQISLIILVTVSTICIIALTIFAIRFLYSANKLTVGLNDAVNTVNSELKPVVADLKETLSGVNSLVKTADSRVKFVNCALNGIVGATGVLGGKLKSVLQGIQEGFKVGINLFRK